MTIEFHYLGGVETRQGDWSERIFASMQKTIENSLTHNGLRHVAGNPSTHTCRLIHMLRISHRLLFSRQSWVSHRYTEAGLHPRPLLQQGHIMEVLRHARGYRTLQTTMINSGNRQKIQEAPKKTQTEYRSISRRCRRYAMSPRRLQQLRSHR